MVICSRYSTYKANSCWYSRYERQDFAQMGLPTLSFCAFTHTLLNDPRYKCSYSSSILCIIPYALSKVPHYPSAWYFYGGYRLAPLEVMRQRLIGYALIVGSAQRGSSCWVTGQRAYHAAIVLLLGRSSSSEITHIVYSLVLGCPVIGMRADQHWRRAEKHVLQRKWALAGLPGTTFFCVTLWLLCICPEY